MDLFRLTPSELQGRGSNSKGTTNICGKTELSGIRARTGKYSVLPDRRDGRSHFFFSEPFCHRASRQGIVSETLSTWITLFALPWRFPETPRHTTFRPIQAISRRFFVLMTCLGSCFKFSKNPSNKQRLASVSPVSLAKWPQADRNVAHAWWPHAEHRQQLTLACTSWEVPEPAH